jgi:serine/threonine-protein kinase
VIEAHLSAPAPVPSALVPSAQPLDRVVTRALAKEPGRRFADATQFRAAIRDALPPRTARTPPVTGARPAEPTPTRVLPLRSGWEPGESTSPTATHLAPVAARPAHGLDYLEPSSDDTAAGGVPPRTARPAGGGVLVAGVAIAAIAVLAVLSAFAPTSHPQEAPTPVWTPTPAVSVSASPTATRAAAVRIIVPTLHGTLAEVESALKAAGLTLGQVSHLESAEPSGTVLEQKPDAGAAVARGTAVNVQLASGSNIVPPVAGLSAAAAVAALQSAGFTVAADTPILAGTTTVLGTEPAEGTVLRLGVTVTLVLDAGFATPTPTPSGSPTATASP